MDNETPKQMLERIVKEAQEAASQVAQSMPAEIPEMTEEERKAWEEKMKAQRQGVGSRYV